MAGEYSRELSQKVFTGQCRLIELGYRQGGPLGFGLRRMLIDERGVAKGILECGQHKSIQTDRVTLVPGPKNEIAIVREILLAFVEDRKSETEIAKALNARGFLTDLGRAWTRGTVHQILINEKYIGNIVWNRSSFKLKKRRVRNDPEAWVRAEGVFEGIVDPDLFAAASANISAPVKPRALAAPTGRVRAIRSAANRRRMERCGSTRDAAPAGLAKPQPHPHGRGGTAMSLRPPLHHWP